MSSASANNKENYVENAMIQGIVKEAVTCVPNPLVYAKVSAFAVFHGRFVDVTDENGSFNLSVPPGIYLVIARKDGYRQASPLIGHFIFAQPGKVVDISFMMKLGSL